MWKWESHAPGGGNWRGRFGCDAGPAMRGGSLAASIRASAQFDIGVLHHAAPQRHLRLDVSAELFRRVLSRFDVEVGEARAHQRRSQRLVETGIEFLHDRR